MGGKRQCIIQTNPPAGDRAGPNQRQVRRQRRDRSRHRHLLFRLGWREGLATDERAELVRLRRELRTAQMEVEILRRAAAYFAKERLPSPK